MTEGEKPIQDSWQEVMVTSLHARERQEKQVTSPRSHQQCVLFKLGDPRTRNGEECVQSDRAGWERKVIPSSHQIGPPNHRMLRWAVIEPAPSTGQQEGSTSSSPHRTLQRASSTHRHSGGELLLEPGPPAPNHSSPHLHGVA